MTAFLPLFRVIGRQLLIVALVLLSLPIVIRILWKLRLLPLGCYFVATKLFWPRWATCLLYTSRKNGRTTAKQRMGALASFAEYAQNRNFEAGYI